MSDQKLTNPLLIIRGVAQKASKQLSEALTGSEYVQLRVYPIRPLFTTALLLHSVLAQKGYIVETVPSFSLSNSHAPRKNEVKIELGVSNKTTPKTATLLIRSDGRTERYTLPYNPATQMVFFFLAEEISVATDEMRVIGNASILQHDIVPQDQGLIDILRGMGVQNCASKFLPFIYSKNLSIVDSLVSTLKPFLPGITLEDPEIISTELKSRGINPNDSVHDIDEQKLKQVINYVAEKASMYTKLPLQFSKIIPSVYALENVGKREYDLRMIAGILDILVEINPLSIITAFTYRDVRILEVTFNLYSNQLKEIIKHVFQSKSIIVSSSRVLVVENVDLPIPLSYIKDNLAIYGAIQSDETIVIKKDSRIVSNCFSLGQACRMQLRIVGNRNEWCCYNVENEEINKYI